MAGPYCFSDCVMPSARVILLSFSLAMTADVDCSSSPAAVAGKLGAATISATHKMAATFLFAAKSYFDLVLVMGIVWLLRHKNTPLRRGRAGPVAGFAAKCESDYDAMLSVRRNRSAEIMRGPSQRYH